MRNHKVTNKNIFNVLAIILILSLVWIVMKSFYINPKRLENEDTAYTIATVASFEMPADGGMDVNFIYKVNNKIYKGFFNYSKLSVKINDRFYLKFLKSSPDVSEFLFNMPVPQSITTSPKNGWEQIP